MSQTQEETGDVGLREMRLPHSRISLIVNVVCCPSNFGQDGGDLVGHNEARDNVIETSATVEKETQSLHHHGNTRNF